MDLIEKKKILETWKERDDSINVFVSNHMLYKTVKGENAYTDKIYFKDILTFKKNIEKTVLNGEICLPKGMGRNELDLRYGPICFPFDLKKDRKEQLDNYELILITAIKNPYGYTKKLMDSPFEKVNIQLTKKQFNMFKE